MKSDLIQGIPLGKGVTWSRFDERGFGALEKPSGVRTHPNKGQADSGALLTCPYDMVKECYSWSAGKLWLVHRLDAATSGVLLVALNEEWAKKMRDAFKKQSVGKVYQALVFGIPKRPEELWRDRMMPEKEQGKIRVETDRGMKAETMMRVLKRQDAELGPMSLLELTPKTGRTHQLRVQCANRKVPIIGDKTYGFFRENREWSRRTGVNRLMLHAAEVSWEPEATGKRWIARAATPKLFRELLS